MLNFQNVEAAIWNARNTDDGEVSAYCFGYSDGLTAAKKHKHIDHSLNVAKDSYARGYSAGFFSWNEQKRNLQYFVEKCNCEADYEENKP